MNSDLVAVSNNPLVWEYAGSGCRRVEGSALGVLYACLDMLGTQRYSLHTHPVAGNARLLHNPFRTILLKEGAPSPNRMLRDLRYLELYIGKLESMGGEAPRNTFGDYRAVDYGLFLGMLPEGGCTA